MLIFTMSDPNKPPGGPAPLTGPDAIALNVSYFTKTVPGYLKIGELLLGIICMACGSPAWNPATNFFLFAAVVGFIGTILWSFVYLLSLRSALGLHINWILSELLFTGMYIQTFLHSILKKEQMLRATVITRML